MSGTTHTIDDLKRLQAMSFNRKIHVTQTRLEEFHRHYNGAVCVSFSGGKDSTALADLTARMLRVMYLDNPDRRNELNLVFCDTGLEYPEIKTFVRTFADWLRTTYAPLPVNLEIVRAAMTFRDVLTKYGYPVISKDVAKSLEGYRRGKQWEINKMNGLKTNGEPQKPAFRNRFQKFIPLAAAPFQISNYCCDVMKKRPIKQFERRMGYDDITAIMAEERVLRKTSWLKTGCNSFDNAKSNPMSFWCEQDVLLYLRDFKIPVAPVYGGITECDPQIQLDGMNSERKLCTTGFRRTGCMFCMFGLNQDTTPNRFQRMKRTHPKLWRYCIEGGHYENGLLVPDADGLGIGKVLDYLGKSYN
ncbi:hypothetical protein FACS1894217_04550 [Clostridia bacterium]|nr:hypothetical protein FACS1894217_04550 [Clostridia bacterium]